MVFLAFSQGLIQWAGTLGTWRSLRGGLLFEDQRTAEMGWESGKGTPGLLRRPSPGRSPGDWPGSHYKGD